MLNFVLTLLSKYDCINRNLVLDINRDSIDTNIKKYHLAATIGTKQAPVIVENADELSKADATIVFMTHDHFVKFIRKDGECARKLLVGTKIWIDEAENLLSSLFGMIVDDKKST